MKKHKPTSYRVTQMLWGIVRFVIIFGLAFIILKPFYIKITAGFMTREDLLNPAVSLIPSGLSLTYWKSALTQLKLPASLLYTLGLSLSVGLIQVVICTMAGYGLGRFHFKGRGLIFAAVILIMLVPADVTSTAQYIRFVFFGVGKATVNLLDSYWPLYILAFTGTNIKNGLYIYLMREFFRTMPGNLEEAAYIDGCGPIQAFLRVMVPNARGMMTTVFLFSFCWQWTESDYARMYFSEIPLFGNVFANITGATVMETSIIRNAGAILILIPLVLLFLIFQKTLVKSITLSGLAN